MAGKVKRVERSSSSALDALHFGYGASGHRIMKQVTDDPDLGEGYREHYIRDAQCLSRPSGSNIMATYHYSNPAGPGVSLRVKEWPIYGSSRVGQYIRGTDMYGEDLLTPPTEYVVVTEPMHPGHTHYELNDHLGNVSAVVTGQLLPGGAASAWQPRLLSAQGYEPFGALLPGRKFDVLQAIPILKLHRMLLVGETVEVDLGGTIVTLANYNAGYTTIGEYLVDIQSALSTNGITGAIANGAIQIGNWPAATDLTSPSELASLTTTSSYRFGFDTQEQDNEIYGAPSTSMTAEYWQYDTRTARRWNLDPIDQISISNYAVFGLNPILNVDHNGAWFWESKNIRQGRQFARATGGEFSKSNGNAFVDVSSLEGNNTGGAVSFRFMKGQDRGDLLSSVGVDFRDRMAATTSGWDSFVWSAKSLDYATKPGHTPPAAIQALINLNPIVGAGNVYSGLTQSTDVFGQEQGGVGTAVEAGLLFIPGGGFVKAGARSTVTRGASFVYEGIDQSTGAVKYGGISSRAKGVRWSEHLASGTEKALLDYRVVPGANGLSRLDARIIEQKLINHYGLPNLLNIRNSIAPKYWNKHGINP